jgi:hypothetical protein
MKVSVTQSGTIVTGSLTLDNRSAAVPISGSIATDGAMTVAGSVTDVFDLTITLQQWDTITTGSSMSGTFVFTLTSRIGGAVVQELRIQAAVLDLNKA